MNVKKIAIAAALAGLSIATAQPATADNILSPYEQQYADSVYPAICGSLDVDRTVSNLMSNAIAAAVVAGVTLDDGVDIVNYVVYTYCYRHWDWVQSVGDNARNGGY